MPLARLDPLRFDWLLLLSVVGIVATGMVFLHSASESSFYKQVQWLSLGVVLMVTMLWVDYRWLLRNAYWLYLGALGLLVVVLALPATRGAKSWIRIPGVSFSIQPSEIMKLALVLVLARCLMSRDDQPTVRGMIRPFLLTLIPLGLILKQPDLGTGILLPPLLLCVVYASGARRSHLFAVVMCGIASAVPLWMFVMKEYQKDRVRAFLDPTLYSAREAYQLIMSLIAIGSGGLYGEGLGEGTQNALDLLPDKHTDFIFGVIAEEGGFVVAAGLLGLYLLFTLCGLHIARYTREPGGRLIAVGVTCLIAVQTIINVGVVTAVLPTTGITLPLVSYGGSSMLVSCAMVGLLLNVGASRPLVMGPERFTGEIPNHAT